MTTLAGSLVQGREIFGSILERWMERPGHPSSSLDRQRVYFLLYAAATGDLQLEDSLSREGSIERLRNELHASSPHPLGILGLPVSAYVDLATALSRNGDISPEEAIVPFLNAYNIAIRETIHNHYHWSRMLLPFHPAEPDIIGVLALSHVALLKTGGSLFSLLEDFPLGWASRVILVDVLQQRFKLDEEERV